MPEPVSRIVKAIQRVLEDSMGVGIVEERIVQFIVQEIHSGRTLEEALKEPYVINNTRPEWRREVLERPEIVRAVEEEMEKAFGKHGGGED